MRIVPLLPLILLAACGADEEPAPERPGRPAAAAPAPAPQRDAFSAGEAASTEEKDAAEVARTYFGYIAARRYEDAWDLRWRSGGADRDGFAAFAANFDRYESYNAQVGPPRPAQEADGAVFVDVPVQLYGRLRNGEGFGSAGMVTLRRKAGDANGGWRIYS